MPEQSAATLAFVERLRRIPVQAVAAYVAEDLRALALAFPDELLFASALQAIGDELGRLARDPNRGVRMQGHYADWHRTAFSRCGARATPQTCASYTACCFQTMPN